MKTPFLEYVTYLIELHHLDKIGNNDSDEADEIRDKAEELYYQLTKEQVRLVNILSASLNEERDPIGYNLSEQFNDKTTEGN